MTQDTLSAFFGWLTVLHLGLFTLSAVLMLLMQDWAASLHARMFGLAPADVSLTIYRWLGTYKILILTTALGPWAALQLI
ncbi:DUF6868 family protein [Leisingera methylohalidivorans]|uniref:DUF6868 domain-containing protein n=1 Tax=Leisingera methylohalidivorans DSM 14336 TaxID=999552 RepID=V9VS76_9RHOB|nr:hypothetical protein [Leisingera methylohalidivorans]AHC99711.1 hypothetical protein METH_02375 [Leisingera methylohalidivorans DSM 14336]